MPTTARDRLDGAPSTGDALTDLSALEALTGTGIAVRTGPNAWALRSVAVSGSFLSLSNSDGVAGDPTVTLTLSGNLSTLQGLASIAELLAINALAPDNDDFLQRKSGAWATRTILQVKADLNYGTAANYNVGTSAGNVVQLDGSAKLPAVDGSQLTNLNVPTGGVTIVGTLTTTSGASQIVTGLSSYKLLMVAFNGVSPSNNNATTLDLSASTDDVNYGSAKPLTGNVGSASAVIDGACIVIATDAAIPRKPIFGWSLESSAANTLQLSGTVAPNSSAAISALKFTFSSGANFDAGTIVVYGIK